MVRVTVKHRGLFAPQLFSFVPVFAKSALLLFDPFAMRGRVSSLAFKFLEPSLLRVCSCGVCLFLLQLFKSGANPFGLDCRLTLAFLETDGGRATSFDSCPCDVVRHDSRRLDRVLRDIRLAKFEGVCQFLVCASEKLGKTIVVLTGDTGGGSTGE